MLSSKCGGRIEFRSCAPKFDKDDDQDEDLSKCTSLLASQTIKLFSLTCFSRFNCASSVNSTSEEEKKGPHRQIDPHNQPQSRFCATDLLNTPCFFPSIDSIELVRIAISCFCPLSMLNSPFLCVTELGFCCLWG